MDDPTTKAPDPLENLRRILKKFYAEHKKDEPTPGLTREEATGIPESVRLLLEYAGIATGPRQDGYGDPYQCYTRAVQAFNALRPVDGPREFTIGEGFLFLVCVKLARNAWRHKRDNLGDAAAFLSFWAEAYSEAHCFCMAAEEDR